MKYPRTPDYLDSNSDPDDNDHWEFLQGTLKYEQYDGNYYIYEQFHGIPVEFRILVRRKKVTKKLL